uniref:BZIP domain-containing protein n=1 Tax=Myripristis murdjan TaxID=586833 RepID=A0A667YIG5_9TELE
KQHPAFSLIQLYHFCPEETFGQIKDDSSKSAFVPTVNAITSSQELQWMVQPAVLPSKSGVGLQQAEPYLPRDGNDPRAMRRSCPGVIRAVGNTQGQSRRHLVTQSRTHDEERRRLRRERNKLAAAKCRNRRTELTNHLQGVSILPLSTCFV